MSLYTVIGAMSGTSMDGLDLALCQITVNQDGDYAHKILNTKTFEYPNEILTQLEISKSLPAIDLFLLDKLLGKHYAACINSFINEADIDSKSVDVIASHGHTVYHQPENQVTVQIGCGTTIAKQTGIPVINDFRQKDVIFGGQGAPLVPIGDQLLFKDRADAFLNIGGFTNISIPGNPTIAFDICPGNLPMNKIASKMGYRYDDGGKMARSGKLDKKILDRLNNLEFYHQKPPKSLGTEWLESSFNTLLTAIPEPKDQLHTCVVHIAEQIASVYHANKIQKLFVTGGGVFNSFLMDSLKEQKVSLVIPSHDEINFKEALIFALLGVRFLEGKHNCLSSVTGASRNVKGGVLHEPN